MSFASRACPAVVSQGLRCQNRSAFSSNELGGRGHSYHVAVFRLFPGGATLVWRAVLSQTVTDPAALLIAIEQGKVDDDPRNGF